MGRNAELKAIVSAQRVTPEALSAWNAEALARFGRWPVPDCDPRVEMRVHDSSEYFDYGVSPALVPLGFALVDIDLHGERYYGPEYMRGRIDHIVAVAEWAGETLRPLMLLYGDDTGASLEPFDAEARSALLEHFRRHGNAGWT